MKNFEWFGASGEEFRPQQHETDRPPIDGHIARLRKDTHLSSKTFTDLADIILSELAEFKKAMDRLHAPDHIWFKDKDAYERIENANILYLMSDRNYTEIHLTDESKRVSSKTMKVHESNLGYPFFRTDKSHMVNLNQVKHLRVGKKLHVVLPNDIEVPVSRDRLTELKEALSIQD